MKRTTLVVLISIVLTNFALVNANAGSMCNNGTMSANSGRGTCSYNGGVDKNSPSFSDPGSSSFNRNNGYGSTLVVPKTNSYGSILNSDPYGFNAYKTGTQGNTPLGSSSKPGLRK